MEPMDWSASAAWIALAISIITPTVSLLLNNLHQRKMKRLELRHQKEMSYYQKQSEVFKNFLTASGSHLRSMTGDIFAYTSAYHEVFMYVPCEYWDLLISFDKAVRSRDSDKSKANALYLDVTKILASLLQEQRKQIPV